MCENVGPLAQYSHSDSYIYLLILIAMLVIFALSTFQLNLVLTKLINVCDC